MRIIFSIDCSIRCSSRFSYLPTICWTVAHFCHGIYPIARLVYYNNSAFNKSDLHATCVQCDWSSQNHWWLCQFKRVSFCIFVVCFYFNYTQQYYGTQKVMRPVLGGTLSPYLHIGRHYVICHTFSAKLHSFVYKYLLLGIFSHENFNKTVINLRLHQYFIVL